MKHVEHPHFPNDEDIRLTREAERITNVYVTSQNRNKKITVSIQDSDNCKNIELPFFVFEHLINLLHEIAEGNAVTIIPIHTVLTTQQAADMLNISRPYLVKILDEGDIPFHKAGTHRRIFAKDILDYKEKRYKEQMVLLDEMRSIEEELGLL